VVILVPSEEVIPLEIGVEEALKYVVSAGFLLPERPSESSIAPRKYSAPFP
jgi:uncharacterized membrane protein